MISSPTTNSTCTCFHHEVITYVRLKISHTLTNNFVEWWLLFFYSRRFFLGRKLMDEQETKRKWKMEIEEHYTITIRGENFNRKNRKPIHNRPKPIYKNWNFNFLASIEIFGFKTESEPLIGFDFRFSSFQKSVLFG